MVTIGCTVASCVRCKIDAERKALIELLPIRRRRRKDFPNRLCNTANTTASCILASPFFQRLALSRQSNSSMPQIRIVQLS